MEKKEYRSAIRSRKMIRQAFYELLKEKNFEKITVTDIVKRADVNRSTFYAHYPDVMGVVEEIQTELLDYTQSFMENIDFKDYYENPKPYLQEIINLVAENNELYRLLMTSAMATKQFDQLKANSKCVWCELLYSPVDEDYCNSEDYVDEEQIVDEFVKEVVVVMGKKLVIQKG